MCEKRKQEKEELAVYDPEILIVIIFLGYLSLIPTGNIVLQSPDKLLLFFFFSFWHIVYNKKVGLYN